MAEGIRDADDVVVCIVGAKGGVTERIDGAHDVAANVVFVDRDVSKTVGDGLAATREIVVEGDGAASSVGLTDKTSVIIVTGCEGAITERVDDGLEESAPGRGRMFDVLKGVGATSAVDKGGEIAVFVVDVFEGDAAGGSDVRNAAFSVAGEGDTLAGAVRNAVPREGERVGIPVRKFAQSENAGDLEAGAFGSLVYPTLRIERVNRLEIKEGNHPVAIAVKRQVSEVLERGESTD